MKQRQCNGAKTAFSQMALNKLNTDTQKIKKSRHRSFIHHRINSKWIRDLNAKCKAIKHLGEHIDGLGYHDAFWLIISNTWSMREITDKWDFI